MAKRRAKSKRPTRGGKRWSGRVTRESDALTLEKGVFTKTSPRAIALSLKRSADRSRRRKSNAYRSAMSMLTILYQPCRERASKGTKAEAAKGQERAAGTLPQGLNSAIDPAAAPSKTKVPDQLARGA